MPIGSDGAGGGGYLFYARPALATPAFPAELARGGDGAELTLLDGAVIEGTVHAGIDFVSRYFGGFNFDLSGGSSLGVDLIIRHTFNSKSFDVVRTVMKGFRAGADDFFPLSLFDRVSAVPIGTYTDGGGNAIDITAEDLRGPTTLSLILRLKGLNASGNRTRIQNPSFSWDRPQAQFYQIAGGVA